MGIFWRAIAGILALALAGLGAPAHGQTTPDPQVISPLRVESEVNGVNVATGRTTPDVPVLSVPAAPNLRFDRAQNAALYVSGRIYQHFDTGSEARRFAFHLGEASDSIECFDGAPCESKSGSGAFVPKSGLTYTQAGTGILYRFNVMHLATAPVNWEKQILYYVGSVEYPDGERLTYSYDDATLTTDQYGRVWRRPARITSTRGFYIDIAYQPGALGEAGWGTPAQATLYASADPATPLGRLTYSGNTVTDLAGRVYTCTCGSSLGLPTETVSASMQLPGDAAPSVQVTGHPTLNLVNAVTRDGVSSTYSYTNPQFQPALSGPAGIGYSYSALTVTRADGYHQVYNLGVNLTKGLQYITSMTDSLNRTTAYSYDNLYRVREITYPELNSAHIIYDVRGNVTSLTRRARPGTGLADIVESAHYETEPCNRTNQTEAVLCWRPTWTRDGMLRQTDYAYNGRGQLTERLDPADAGGVRRRTSIIHALSPIAGISRPAEVRICADTGATCGTNAPVRTEYQYWGETGLVTLERRIDGATGATLDTSHSYDNAGRLLSTDGPLSGAGDTSYNRYDAAGQPTGTISPDPDGAGSLPHLAVRTSYDPAGRPIRQESGTLAAWQAENVEPANWTGFTITRTAETQYAQNRKIREWMRESSAGIVRTLTEHSYDAAGRLECTAVRMNTAAFSFTGTPDACLPNAESPDGPDRITRNLYDNAGQRLQHRVGVGYPLVEAADATWEYNQNGLVRAVIDGNGNRAELGYDGHMRQDRWTFPSASGPAGTVNAGDYEAYSYDAAGNRLTYRKRDGSVLAYQYDDLNRMTRKTVPERAGLSASQTRDVFYGYDLRNAPLFARFDSVSGEGVTNTYDGLGRLTSTAIDMGGTTRTLGYSHDEAGRRRIVTYPDGNHFELRYDGASRLISIGENGASFGSGQVAAWGYDPNGRPAYLSRPGIAPTLYAFDPLSRLTAVGHDLQGSADDLGLDFAYNPASGVRSTTRSNDAYAWGGHYAVSRTYLTNGLNQYSQTASNLGAANFAYDANGNLTSDGPNSYIYDVENRLIVAYGAHNVTLVYDPLGRIFQYSYLTGGSWITTSFLHDGDALVAEYDAGGNLAERYVHGPGADVPLVWYHGSGLTDRRWLHADHQGSIVAVSNGSGALGGRNAYDEYGIPASTNSGRFQYTGQIWLPDLGMYHYKARIYSPFLGRFLQTDPVGYDDQFNLYAYVANDPVNNTDPDGRYKCAMSSTQCEKFNQAQNRAIRQLRSSISALRGLRSRLASGRLTQADRRLQGQLNRYLGRGAGSSDQVVAATIGVANRMLGALQSDVPAVFQSGGGNSYVSTAPGPAIARLDVHRNFFATTDNQRTQALAHDAHHEGLNSWHDEAPSRRYGEANAVRRALTLNNPLRALNNPDSAAFALGFTRDDD